MFVRLVAPHGFSLCFSTSIGWGKIISRRRSTAIICRRNHLGDRDIKVFNQECTSTGERACFGRYSVWPQAGRYWVWIMDGDKGRPD